MYHLIGESVKSLDAALVFTTQRTELENPIEGQPRSNASFHDNLPDSMSKKGIVLV